MNNISLSDKINENDDGDDDDAQKHREKISNEIKKREKKR